MKKIILFLIFNLCGLIVNSQILDRELSFPWFGVKIDDRDAIIIEEDTKLEFSMIDGVNTASVKCSKKSKVIIKSKKAVNYFSRMSITNYFDQSYIIHSPQSRNHQAIFTDIYDDVLIAKRININGNIKELPIKKEFKEVQTSYVEIQDYMKIYQVFYNISDFNVGDTILIEYEYKMPFRENFFNLASSRIFFNGMFTKLESSYEISYDPEIYFDFQFENGAQPDTSYTLDKKHLKWNFKNTPGNIFEVGSNPYKELPYVLFNIYINRFLVYETIKTEKLKFWPYYAIIAYNREEGVYSYEYDLEHGITSKQYSKLNKFINQLINEGDSLSDVKKMAIIHNCISKEFDYQNDIRYLENKDIGKDRMGDFTEKKILREISRYPIYGYFLAKLGIDFYTIYVADKRSAKVSPYYSASMTEGDYLFSVMSPNDVFTFMYPKKSRYGLYYSEIPFYFENTDARVVHKDCYLTMEDSIDTLLYKIKLPGSIISDNQRKTNTLININLENKKMDFNTRINLSGQYSTMTRGVYQYHVKDETVNPLYNKKIWEDVEGVSDTSATVKILSKEFPFNANVNVSYASSELLQQHNDSISIDLANWFKHIIYPGMDIENRTLDFYPDFQMRDTYVYFLKFDKDVELLKNFDDVNIKNDFGELKISIEQTDSKSIKISSSYAITADKIDAEDIIQVGEIFQSIESLNEAKLALKLAE